MQCLQYEWDIETKWLVIQNGRAKGKGQEVKQQETLSKTQCTTHGKNDGNTW